MSRILRPEIKEALRTDNRLAADFCNAIGVSIISLPPMLYRNPKSLTQHDAVAWLSEHLNKTPDQILTEANSESHSKISSEKAVQ
jgi:hypothetical protein